MKKTTCASLIFIAFAGLSIQARTTENNEIKMAVLEALQTSECSLDISINGVCQDINNIYNLVTSSINDSNFNASNQLLVPYKFQPCEMRLILSTRKTVSGIAYSSLLHEAAKGNNAAISANIFTKASYVGDQEYLPFAKELANAVDGNGKKPIDYTTNQQIINLLTYFMNLP